MKKAADEAVTEAAFEKGRKEEKHEIALAMLKEKLPVKQISKLTGLSVEEITSLKK